MTNYLLDTDHLIGLIGSEKPIIDRLRKSVKAGDRFSICVTVLGELYWFAKSTAQMDTNTACLTELVAELPVFDMDRGAAEIVGEILLEHGSLGVPISRPAAEVSAIARQRRLVVLSSDPDFRSVRDIRVEDWRAAERG
ncbi:MAG: type II toxin-antitoxin system VapC family toxin [Armatimonadota bacterium]|nr:type II toxin-antitoxin system VapC family toxin [Armatimonadota bacterium]